MDKQITLKISGSGTKEGILSDLRKIMTVLYDIPEEELVESGGFELPNLCTDFDEFDIYNED